VQALVAPLIQSRTGGLVLHVEQRAQAVSPTGARRFRGTQMEDAHVAAVTLPRAVVDVAADSWPAFIQLLTSCPGTAADYQMCLLTVTADDATQRVAVTVANALMAAGMTLPQIGFIRWSLSPLEADTAYPLITEFYAGHGLEYGCAPAVVHDPEGILRKQRDGVPPGEWLHGKTDFQAQLDEAWRAGADQGVRDELARKVLTQRRFTNIRANIMQAFDALGLPRISSQEWIEESERLAAAGRGAPLQG
jgi:hypothetical protein